LIKCWLRLKKFEKAREVLKEAVRYVEIATGVGPKWFVRYYREDLDQFGMVPLCLQLFNLQ
jgi:pentatricopeptide repeat protein